MVKIRRTIKEGLKEKINSFDSFRWDMDLVEVCGSRPSARRYIQRTISKCEATPLDAPIKPTLYRIPDGKIKTPFHLLAYIVQNRSEVYSGERHSRH